MKGPVMKRTFLILVLGIAAIPGFAQQDASPSDDESPARGVARLSVLNGEVSVRRGDSGDFIAAAINAPLVATDQVITGPQSRAEVQFDWANMIRIGSNSEVRLSELELRRYQVQIAIGTTTFRVLRSSAADVEISTPSVSVRPLGIGVFRVMVREDGSSEVTVRGGEVEIFTVRGSERLRAGSTMLARGPVHDPEFQNVAAIPLDDWDRWNADRDRDLERSHSYQYVSSEISGAEDLEGHGRWVSAEGYGNVWAPEVDPGWAPYRYGRWVWEDYYGWTWVSYDPWGWAPYHYGRWFHSASYGWCWWPGGIHERHHWRPALVAFFGWGNNGGYRSGVGFGWGNVGWVPLAPHETFHPWYGRGYYGAYRGSTIAGTAVINSTNISSVYRNARVNNGVTAVNADLFGRRGITRGDVIHVSGDQLHSADLMRGALPIAPGRESLHLADRPSAALQIRTTENRAFFSRRPAHAVDRVPFEQQRQSIERSAKRTLGDASGTPSQSSGWRRVETPVSVQPGAPQSSVSSRNRNESRPSYRSAPQQDPNGQGTWHRFGDPIPHNSLNPTAPAPPAPQDPNSVRTQDNGWRRFSATEVPSYQGAPQSQPVPRDRSTNGGEYQRGTSSDSRGNGQAVRINPPMVRERPNESRDFSGSRPQQNNSQPAQRSAPAQSPRSTGGNSGGGNSSSHGSGGNDKNNSGSSHNRGR